MKRHLLILLAVVMGAGTSLAAFPTNENTKTIALDALKPDFSDFRFEWNGFDDQRVTFTIESTSGTGLDISGYLGLFRATRQASGGTNVIYIEKSTSDVTITTSNFFFTVAHTAIPPDGVYKAELLLIDSGSSNVVRTLGRGKLKVEESIYASDGSDFTFPSVTGSLGDASDVTLTSVAQGDILYRNASAWVNLGAGTSGQVLETQGAGANPQWANVDTTNGLASTNWVTEQGYTKDTTNGLALTNWVTELGYTSDTTNGLALTNWVTELGYTSDTTNGLALTNWVTELGYTSDTTNGLALTNWVTELGYTSDTTNGLALTNWVTELGYTSDTTNGLALTNWVTELGYTSDTTNGLALTNWVTELGYTSDTTNGLASTNWVNEQSYVSTDQNNTYDPTTTQFMDAASATTLVVETSITMPDEVVVTGVNTNTVHLSNGTVAALDDWNMGGQGISNMLAPTAVNDAATKGYADSRSLTNTIAFVDNSQATNVITGPVLTETNNIVSVKYKTTAGTAIFHLISANWTNLIGNHTTLETSLSASTTPAETVMTNGVDVDWWVGYNVTNTTWTNLWINIAIEQQ